MHRCCGGSSSSMDETPSIFLVSGSDQPSTLEEPSTAQELAALTVEEREKVYEDIHGIADVIEETPDLVTTSLHQMREELAMAPKRKRATLDRAIFLKPSIALDDDFHLLFLRAERFDPQRAAVKMYSYFDHKLELFGDDKRLVKNITLDDLGPEEMRHMYEGTVQVVKVHEEKGTMALYTRIAGVTDMQDGRPFLRYIWYQLSAALEDEQTQKQGLVEVSNACGTWHFTMQHMLNHFRSYRHILNDRPVRINAIHLLYDQPSLASFLRSLTGFMKRHLKLRNRFHFGSPIELDYVLRTFGIRLPDCFTPGQGIFTREHIDSYLEERRSKEAEREQKEKEKFLPATRRDCVLYPSQDDVLMGRGRPYQSWHGNIRLSAIVQEFTSLYHMQVERHDKTKVAATVVRRVQERGRFLQRSDRYWEPVQDRMARYKVSQLLRADGRNRPELMGACEIGMGRAGNAATTWSEEPFSETKQSPSKRHRSF